MLLPVLSGGSPCRGVLFNRQRETCTRTLEVTDRREKAAELEHLKYEEWAQQLRKDAELVQMAKEHQMLSSATAPL
jgi:hypothetical protein